MDGSVTSLVSPMPATKEGAQLRVDQIQAFRSELAQLEHDKVVNISPEQHDQIFRHHAAVLANFARMFDVDTTIAAKQMSVGMRIVSFLGAVALSAAVF